MPLAIIAAAQKPRPRNAPFLVPRTAWPARHSSHFRLHSPVARIWPATIDPTLRTLTCSILKPSDDFGWNVTRFQTIRIGRITQSPDPYFAPVDNDISVVVHPVLDHEYLAAPFADPALDHDLIAEARRSAKAGAGVNQCHARHPVFRKQPCPRHAAGAEHSFGGAIEPIEIARIKDDARRIAIGEIDDDFISGRRHILRRRGLGASPPRSVTFEFGQQIIEVLVAGIVDHQLAGALIARFDFDFGAKFFG